MFTSDEYLAIDRSNMAGQMRRPGSLITLLLLVALLGAPAWADSRGKEKEPVASVPTAADAAQFLEESELQIREVSEEGARLAWLAANFINYDSQFVVAKHDARSTLMAVKMAKRAAEFDDVTVDPVSRRKLNTLKQAIRLPAPDDKTLAQELSTITAGLEATYGKGKYCPASKGSEGCLDLVQMNKIMASSRDADELRDVWQGWRTVAPPMKADYVRQVEITNQGAQELGFKDLGAMWRSGYDMAPDDFSADADAQWERVKPLYEALHCHVREKLGEHYGKDLVAAGEKIPAHLLGNMWAQQWGNVYDLVKPKKIKASGVDITELIEDKNMSELDMVRTAENFFVSLGLEKLPETFWERSLFVQPQDRDVVCHASAWNLDSKDDIRIKMCIQKDAEDFTTIHHELGHNYYQRAYNKQPVYFQGSANDGFHEALGDTIALSVTPDYLQKIGMLKKKPKGNSDIPQLLKMALDKVAFLPFGLLVDKWRWQVFSGELKPEDYNSGWWKLREQYQGIEAPVARDADDFDPGAKYHIPGNTPYMRYFLAHIQQFQFHQSLCKTAGYKGPLHECTIYGNKEAGERLNAMMELGSSKPWQDAMTALTGQPELDASALLDYFAPLQAWLDEQNEGRQCGWE